MERIWIDCFDINLKFALRNLKSAIVLSAMLLALSFSVQAQQPKKVVRIGYLTMRSVELEQSWLAAFQQGLRDSGYVEGKNIVIEKRQAAGQFEKLPELLAELVRLKVDVLVVGGDPALHAAKKAISDIPIVMVTRPDPVGTGLVFSRARPGANITGLSDFHAGVVTKTKRLELLKEAVPSASRVAVLLNPSHPTNPLQLKDLQAAAPGLRVTILSLGVRGTDDIDRAFTIMKKERPGALLALGDPTITNYQRTIAELAIKIRLPSIYTIRQFAELGGLMSYGTSFEDLYRRAATYVDKILKGAKPADLPVEQPTKFERVINLKTAKQIGVTIPQSVLYRADKVIK